MSVVDYLFLEEGGGGEISVIPFQRDAPGIAIYNVERNEIDALHEKLVAEEREYRDEPRLLLVRSGGELIARLEYQLDLQLLRVLLHGDWCRWVELETLSALANNADEIETVCDWLEEAGAALRLRRYELEIPANELRAAALTLLTFERLTEDYQLPEHYALAVICDAISRAREIASRRKG